MKKSTLFQTQTKGSKRLTFLNSLFLVLLLLSFSSLNAQSYIINTIAGNGTSSYSGDGGAATAAGLNIPVGVAVDALGNVYIADLKNNCIRKVNNLGVITTIAGDTTHGYSGDGGAATAAELNEPFGVAVDAAGNVYIIDYRNECIRKVSTSGIISTFAGNGTAGYSGDGGAATAAELSDPLGITVDASGDVYIADYGNGRIREVSTSGIITTIAGDSMHGYSGDGGAATAAGLSGPYSVTVDAAGNVYIADDGFAYSHIRKVNTSGIITTIAGDSMQGYSGDGGAATAAELSNPQGVAVDASGNVYIADTYNHRIRKVSDLGIISTIAGEGASSYSGDGGAATAAELNFPSGVAVDASGNIYIADTENSRIRALTISTGIANLSESNNVNLYPNPATTNLSLTFNMQGKTTDASIDILNITGKSMMETNTEISNGKTLPIDICQLASGVYFIKITTATNSQVIKFVKTDR